MYFLYIRKNVLTKPLKNYIIDVIAVIATRCCGNGKKGGEGLFRAE